MIQRGIIKDSTRFTEFIYRVLCSNPYSLIAKDTAGRSKGLIFVSLSDVKSEENLPARHTLIRYAHQKSEPPYCSMVDFWVTGSKGGINDQMLLSTKHLLHHLNRANPETYQIQRLFAYSTPRGYQAHLNKIGKFVPIEEYLALGIDPVLHRFHGRMGGEWFE